MHMLVRILVFAKNEEAALEAAHEVAHEKIKATDNGGPFDYYVDFTDSPRKEPGTIGEEMVAVALSTTKVDDPWRSASERLP